MHVSLYSMGRTIYSSSWNLSALFFLSLISCKQDNSDSKTLAVRPNIIYILADDLGYGDLGAYGQERIETPHLDKLAAEGMLFTQHYASAPVCAPSRYMLLTGKHSGHAYIRGNDEWRERGEVWDYRAMAKDSSLEGQRPLPPGEVLLPQMLKTVGYRTGLFGKWGLGAPHTESIPTKMGFDTFYGYNCQRQAHTYYPLHLYENEHRVHLNNDTIPPHSGFGLTGGEKDYDFFNQEDYAPEHMFDAMMQFIAELKPEPFFVYWATPIPHVPLQAPERWISYYHKKFGAEPPFESGDGTGYFPQEFPRAAYAAMVSYLDEQVGQLVKQLKDNGLYENTLIMFTSDNGPSYAGGADPEWFGSAGPFRGEYGRGKGFVYEGGIRVPLIASWPAKINPGSRTNHVSAQYDMVATLSELTGFELANSGDGISFLPTLLGNTNQEAHQFLIWAYPEYGGQIALRNAEWKYIQRGLNDPDDNPEPELYNLLSDKEEQYNLAAQMPALVDSLRAVAIKEYQIPQTIRFRLQEWERELEP